MIDKMIVDHIDLKRLKSSVATAMKNGKGVMMVKPLDRGDIKYYSRHLMCPDTGISYRDPAPHSFSFNSPHGACPKCKGLGYVNAADIDKIIPNMRFRFMKEGSNRWENIKIAFFFGK